MTTTPSLNAAQLYERIVGESSRATVRPLNITGVSDGLCVRVLTAVESLAVEEDQAALDRFLDAWQGPVDAAAVARAEENANDTDQLEKSNRRVMLRVALMASYIACDSSGEPVFTSDRYSPKSQPFPSAPRESPFRAQREVPVVGDAGVGATCARAVGDAYWTDGPIRANAARLWHRAQQVLAALPFDVVAAIAKGGRDLSEEHRAALGKVSWSAQPSSA